MAGIAQLGRAIGGIPSAELVRYLIVGCANTAFAYGIYVLGIGLGAPYQLASLFALAAGIGVSFVTQGAVVFRSRLQGRFPLFLGLWVLLYCANIALIGALHRLDLSYQLAGLAAAVPLNLIAFVLQRRLVFSRDAPDARRLALPWALSLLAIARFDLAVRSELNWDEFLNLSMVYSHARGELEEVLQTAFIHVLRWVPYVSVNEVDQIIAARMLMLGFVVATSVAIYGIASRFMKPEAALVAVFAYNGLTVAMLHGHALRTDTMAATALMGALWLAVARRPTAVRVAAMAALAGLAGALTIKAAFFLPTLGALLCVRVLEGPNRARALGLLILGGATGLAVLLLIVTLHSETFPAHSSPFSFVERTSEATMLSGDYSIVRSYLPGVIVANPGFWLLAGYGFARAIASVRRQETRIEGLALVSLALPLLSLAVYRDAYPYFFPFILAPVAVLAGLGFAALPWPYKLAAFSLLMVSVLGGYVSAARRDNTQQHFVLATIHRLFPTPVPYIDHTSMVSSFPKQGIFMSRWGMTDYRRQNTPIMADLIERRQPQFVLVTRALLDVDRIDAASSQKSAYGLLAEDVKALQANYQRYWGPIYLPAVKLVPANVARVSISGRYRLDASAPVTLGGYDIEPGATRQIRAGSYAVVSSVPATLRWASPPPPVSSPPDNLFIGF